MISQLHIENFRSIEKATLNLGRITVLTGSNNSGKSSLMYGLACLKYLTKNPSRPLSDIFNLPNIINMGDFEDVVFDAKVDKKIIFGVRFEGPNTDISNKIEIGKYETHANIEIQKPFKACAELTFSLPFTLNKSVKFDAPQFFAGEVGYNGFYLEGLLLTSYEETDGAFRAIKKSLELFNNFSSFFDIIPVRRGFSKINFGQVPLKDDFVTEDEIATVISLDRKLASSISKYLEKIANRSFSVKNIGESAVFRLITKDIDTSQSNDLVNEGTGTNQLVTILAKALQPDKKFICIDEPEIHLHPTMIQKLVEALVEIAYQDQKQFMLSTHSEHFVSCLLAEVVKKKLEPNDLKIYYLTKEKRKTNIEHQAVNEDGQIEGGLKNFYEAELSNLETFFKLF